MALQLRRDIAANWTANNSLLESGQPGYETDTGKIKIGDGVTHWNSLNYIVTGAGTGTWGAINGTIGSQTDLQTELATKQATLVSGTNIKTINGNTLLGAGDLAFATPYKLSAYSNFATAISSIGSTKAILDLDANSNVASAQVVPTTMFLNPSGGVLTKTSTGAIEFQGIGITNPESQTPIFSGFAAGDITWTGSAWPGKITTELWDTGNTSLSDRLDRVNSAFGTKQVTIVCYPRTVTASIDFNQNKEIYFSKGDYLNTFSWVSGPGIYAFGLNNNTYFHGPGRIYESTGVFGCRIIQPTSLSSVMTDIVIEGLTFQGDPAAASDGSGASVILGNAHNSAIRFCYFNGVHNYAAILGGSGLTGNYAYNSEIVGNVFTVAQLQTTAFINTKNCRIANNWFDATGTPEGGVMIDLEPNAPTDTMENIIVENNTIIASDVFNGTTNAIGGISAQGGGGVAEIRGIVIRGNNFIGGTNNTTQLAAALSVIGGTDFVIENNFVRWTFQQSMTVYNSRDGRINNNYIIAGGDASGFNSPLQILGSSDIIVTDNALQSTPTGGGGTTGILEGEQRQGATSSGFVITKTNPSGYPRLFDFIVGLQIFYNGSTYTISSVDTLNQTMTMSGSVGTVTVKTFAPSDVNTGTDQIAITAHGYQTGCIITPSTTGTLPAGFPGVPFPTLDGIAYAFIIRVDADHVKIATTLANALANVWVDLTTQGTGTGTLTPVISTIASSNIFKGNDAAQGHILSSLGSSQIVSTARDNFITSVADTDHTVTTGEGIIVYTALTNARTVNLPDATLCRGKQFTVKDGANAAAAHNITLDGNGSQTIDGSATVAITNNYGVMTIKSDGANWLSIVTSSASGLTMGTTTSDGGSDVLLKTSSTGKVNNATGLTNSSTKQLTATAQSATDVPITIKAASSQSGNYLEINSSSGSGGDLLRFTAPTAGRVNIAQPGVGGNISFGQANLEATFGDQAATGIAVVSHNNGTSFQVRTNTANVNLYVDSTRGTAIKSGDQFGFSNSTTDASATLDTAIKRSVAKVVAATDGSSGTGWFKDAGCKQTAVATNATNTMSNGVLTDLTVTLISGQKYSGIYVFYAKNSTAVEGLQFDFNGGAAGFSSVEFGFVSTPPGSGLVLGTLTSTAIGTAITATTATTADAIYMIAFSGVCNGAGTLIPRFAENSAHTSGTATIEALSYCDLRDAT